MKSFRAEPDGQGLWVVTVDGVEMQKHYKQKKIGKLYKKLWEEEHGGKMSKQKQCTLLRLAQVISSLAIGIITVLVCYWILVQAFARNMQLLFLWIPITIGSAICVTALSQWIDRMIERLRFR